jgi:hypothetical protein
MTALAVQAPPIQYHRPYLYPKQAEFLFAPERYSVVEASTKSGKTTGCMVWLFEQAALHGSEGRNYWWVAPTIDVSRIAFRRLKRAVPRELYSANDTDRTLTLANGAVIWFKGADHPDTLYGEDVYAVVIDEASRCKEDAWYAVRSTLTATKGRARIIGNVKGRKNWAYHFARRAESGSLPDAAYFKLTAYDAVEGGVLDIAEVEDARRTLPDLVFRELYLAEASDDGGNPFGLAAIRAAIGPLSTAPVVTWGVDLAKSEDWTVALGLDARLRTAQVERWQGPWELTLAKLAGLIGRTPALVDSTGVGDPVLEALQKRCPQAEGFKFSAQSKQQIMEGLAVALQQHTVTIPDRPEEAFLVHELEAFEYEYTRTGVRYSAPSGLHDDGVCALALAVHHASHKPVPRNLSFPVIQR